jgi:hypothetical protein
MIFENNNYKYEVNTTENKYNIIHPKLEIAREKVIKIIFGKLFNICKKYNSNINEDKINTYITLFCWKNLTNIDSVIPYRYDNNYDYEQLKTDLQTLKLDANIVLKELDIESLLKLYIDKFDRFYKKLDTKKKINIKVENNKIIYKQKYYVEYTNKIIDKLNKFYDNKYNNDKYALFFCVLYRYKILDGGNQQLAMDFNFKEDLKKNFNLNIELFGSCINRYFDSYCSLFYDVEKYFGSLGNFYDVKPIRGLYFANPPFDEKLMSDMATKLIKYLADSEKDKEPLGFIITVPVWDAEMQKKIAKQCNINYITDVSGYECKDIIKRSGYLYGEYVFCKNNFPYYSYAQDRYIKASNTYIFIIKNTFLNIDLGLFEKLLTKNKLFHIK